MWHVIVCWYHEREKYYLWVQSSNLTSDINYGPWTPL